MFGSTYYNVSNSDSDLDLVLEVKAVADADMVMRLSSFYFCVRTAIA